MAQPFFLGPGSSGLLDLVQGYLHTKSIGSGTYCLSLVHSSRWTRSLFLELLIWADHIPAYLGNSFTCVQYMMVYTCPGPIFQCEFNWNVNLVIRLTNFGNFGTYVYVFSTDFQCGSSCDVNLVIGLTKFGNSGNWYICICIQH